ADEPAREALEERPGGVLGRRAVRRVGGGSVNAHQLSSAGHSLSGAAVVPRTARVAAGPPAAAPALFFAGSDTTRRLSYCTGGPAPRRRARHPDSNARRGPTLTRPPSPNPNPSRGARAPSDRERIPLNLIGHHSTGSETMFRKVLNQLTKGRPGLSRS